MAEIPRNNTGLSGEYFVAAELYRRGWSVGITLGNAKAVDLFAEKGNHRLAVQVKSIYNAKNSGWPLMESNIKDNCIYIFVNIKGDTMELPDYYICTSQEVKTKIKQYQTRGIVTLSNLNNEQFKNKWSKLETSKTHGNTL
ncbi:MAG: hypothetical protein R2797_04690 [Gelidibacter sp.]